MLKIAITARVEWLTPVILATQEAGIRRITVQADPRQTVRETPISKILNTKRAGRVT
jgi:Tfp pilus assembly protein PilZ